MKRSTFLVFMTCMGICAYFAGRLLNNPESSCLASGMRTDNGIEITSEIVGGPMTASPLPNNAALQVAQSALAPRPARQHAPAQKAARQDISLAPPDIARLRPGQTVCLADGACEPVLAVVPLRASWLVRTSAHSGQFGRAGGTISPTPETSRIMGVVR